MMSQLDKLINACRIILRIKTNLGDKIKTERRKKISNFH